MREETLKAIDGRDEWRQDSYHDWSIDEDCDGPGFSVCADHGFTIRGDWGDVSVEVFSLDEDDLPAEADRIRRMFDVYGGNAGGV